MYLKAVTANRLRDGRVVYLSETGAGRRRSRKAGWHATRTSSRA
ncbi:DUF2849 domain-containing protein [Fodinicurvata halophila]